MDVRQDGVNFNKFPPAAKYVLTIEHAYCANFGPHVEDAVAMFPEAVRDGVRGRLTAGSVLADIAAVDHGNGVHSIFEFPLIPNVPVVGDLIRLLTGGVWGPWDYAN